MNRVVFISLVCILLILLTGCFTSTMPTLQCTVMQVRFVTVQGQSATLFTVRSCAFALVPQIELDRGDRLAIYVVDDSTLSVVVNGQDREVKAKLYRLGIAGVNVAEGWDWRHSLAELERQMRSES